jgi:hypothetical protein
LRSSTSIKLLVLQNFAMMVVAKRERFASWRNSPQSRLTRVVRFPLRIQEESSSESMRRSKWILSHPSSNFYDQEFDSPYSTFYSFQPHQNYSQYLSSSHASAHPLSIDSRWTSSYFDQRSLRSIRSRTNRISRGQGTWELSIYSRRTRKLTCCRSDDLTALPRDFLWISLLPS